MVTPNDGVADGATATSTSLTITNTGVGTAHNVIVTDTLPEGLTTLNGQTGVKYTIPVLQQGESKTFNLLTKATKVGNYTNTAMATADGDLSSQASASTTVQQPVLSITKAGPDKRFEGRPVKYTITVSNTCTAELAIGDVRFQGKAPDGVFSATGPAASLLAQGETSTIEVTDEIEIGHVTLSIDLTHTHVGDLVIECRVRPPSR